MGVSGRDSSEGSNDSLEVAGNAQPNTNSGASVGVDMPAESDDVRVWLVERGYTNRDLIILKYATPDGERVFRREVASQTLDTVRAAKEVSPTDLGTVDDPDVRERYATEVERVADEHDPDDAM